jgi:hypothetical protein
MKDKVISTRVEAEVREKLDAICEALDRPQAWVISILIRQADVHQLLGLSLGGSSKPKKGTYLVPAQQLQEHRVSRHRVGK